MIPAAATAELIDMSRDTSRYATSVREEVVIGPHRLRGILSIPLDPTGFVIFAHGSGSSRLSPRNQQVAEALNRVGIGTLLFDLLTESEEAERSNVFDVPLLAWRLRAVTDWLVKRTASYGSLPIGYFGASTGAAAALMAAAQSPDRLVAVVCRGGRPDLALGSLHDVRASTLLIVGSEDVACVPLNSSAFQELSCEKKLALVSGATHLFTEEGTLARATELATYWFQSHFRSTGELTDKGGGRARTGVMPIHHPGD